MNVTIKIDDWLYREARHCAVDSGQSLSGWVAGLIERATRTTVGRNSGAPTDLLEALGNDDLADVRLSIPKLQGAPSPAEFE